MSKNNNYLSDNEEELEQEEQEQEEQEEQQEQEEQEEQEEQQEQEQEDEEYKILNNTENQGININYLEEDSDFNSEEEIEQDKEDSNFFKNEEQSDDKLYKIKNDIFDQSSKYNYSIYDYELDNEDDYNFIDKEVTSHFIINNHPECLRKNNNEINLLCNINKDSNNNINDKFHKTLPILTKYERTRVLGFRVKQLNNNSKPFINISEKILDNYIIANLELEQKKLPFIIERILPNNTYEYWRVKDLELLN
tara:strand:+ start:117 stop:869 length:753 start_codon:yes stop_codon:yes gene_type:complete